MTERLLRRAGLDLARSQGFHPKPRLSFPSALALGLEGRDEVMELELAEPADADAILARLRACAIPGLSFRSVELLAPGTKKAQLRSAVYQMPIPPDRRDDVARGVDRVLSGGATPVRRGGAGPAIDVRLFLEELSLQQGVLRMRLRASRERSATARDVLEALGIADLERDGAVLTRLAVELAP